jgi:serine/threonine-protein kinase HipA
MAAHLRRVSVASVEIWGNQAGAVSWNNDKGFGEFEYAADFLKHGIEIAPLAMPLRPGIFSFPSLNRQTFHGLIELAALNRFPFVFFLIILRGI